MSIKPAMNPSDQFKVIGLTFFSIVILAALIAKVSFMTTDAMAGHQAAGKKDGQTAAHGATGHDHNSHGAPAEEKKAAAPTGDKVAGAKVFMAKTCNSCHAVSSVPGATGAVGPKLDGLGERAGTRVSGLSAEDYIKQSIEKPNAFVVPTFQPMMPELKGSMNEKEFNDLVAFLASL